MKSLWKVIGFGCALVLTSGTGRASGTSGHDASHPSAAPKRIGVVSVQNRSAKRVSDKNVDAILAALMSAERLHPVPLAFQPPADLEYAARQERCDYILYTDIVEIRKTAQWHFAKVLRMISGVGATANTGGTPLVAVVEFRLFALNEVLPRVSTTLNATSGKTGVRLLRSTVHQPDRNSFEDSTLAALAAALEREVEIVRDEVNPKSEHFPGRAAEIRSHVAAETKRR